MIEAANPFMALALDEAEAAFARGEVPVGAVLTRGDAHGVRGVGGGVGGGIVACAGNRTEELNDPTAHAEMLVLRAAAAKLGSPRLVDCDLYVTLEPCSMCATAISFARIRRLYFAAFDAKMGGVEHGARIFTQTTCHHKPEVYGGIGETAAKTLLQRFFHEKRDKKR